MQGINGIGVNPSECHRCRSLVSLSRFPSFAGIIKPSSPSDEPYSRLSGTELQLPVITKLVGPPLLLPALEPLVQVTLSRTDPVFTPVAHQPLGPGSAAHRRRVQRQGAVDSYTSPLSFRVLPSWLLLGCRIRTSCSCPASPGCFPGIAHDLRTLLGYKYIGFPLQILLSSSVQHSITRLLLPLQTPLFSPSS